MYCLPVTVFELIDIWIVSVSAFGWRASIPSKDKSKRNTIILRFKI
jgi:hypothetical protein